MFLFAAMPVGNRHYLSTPVVQATFQVVSIERVGGTSLFLTAIGLDL